MANLIVTRVNALRGILASHTILLDGRDVGKIKNGQTLVFPISAGEHTVTFKPHPSMNPTLGPFTIAVGRTDVHAVIDPGTSLWRCDITGTANNIDLERDLAGGFAQLLRDALNELQRKPNITVFFEKDGARIGLHGYVYSYGSLSGYKIKSLQVFEQGDAAKAFGWYIHESGNDAYYNVYVAGRGVEISRK